MDEGKITEKPWGWEEIITRTNYYVVKRLYVLPRQRLSLQYHERKLETITRETGYTFLCTGRDEELSLLGTVTVEPGQVHRLENRGSETATVLEVSTPELDDVVRLEDEYGRADEQSFY